MRAIVGSGRGVWLGQIGCGNAVNAPRLFHTKVGERTTLARSLRQCIRFTSGRHRAIRNHRQQTNQYYRQDSPQSTSHALSSFQLTFLQRCHRADVRFHASCVCSTVLLTFLARPMVADWIVAAPSAAHSAVVDFAGRSEPARLPPRSPAD